MKKLERSISSLPDDIALKIVSSLQVADICALASCSRYRRQLCGSGHKWEALIRERWPLSGPVVGSAFPFRYPDVERNSKKWRRVYIKQHRKIAKKARSVVKGVKLRSTSNSSKVADYHNAITKLRFMGLGFKDVEIFLLKPNLSVLVNLTGVHYSLMLKVPVKDVLDALQRLKISERQMLVKWSGPGRWFDGSQMLDESSPRLLFLMEFTAAEKQEVLELLFWDALNSDFCVQICPG